MVQRGGKKGGVVRWNDVVSLQKKKSQAKLFKLSYFTVAVRKRNQIDVLRFKRVERYVIFAENIFLNLKSSGRNVRRGG